MRRPWRTPTLARQHPDTAEAADLQDWVARRLTPASPPISLRYGDPPAPCDLARWRHQRTEAPRDGGGTSITLTFTDAATGLAIRLDASTYPDTAAVEWVLHLRNEGERDTPIIEALQVLDVALPCAANPVLHYARGAVCSQDDFRPIRRELAAGAHLHLQPNGGRSSSDYLPFFHLVRTGEPAVMVGLGWSGEWAFDAEHTADACAIRAGMAHTHFRLRPGEQVRTPRVMLQFSRGDRRRGQNALRRHLLTHHRPQVDGRPAPPPVCNTNWGGTPASMHIENVDAIVRHRLPLDTYWIDAEWFGQGPWPEQAGDWRAKAHLYPNGFRPIADALHRAGKRLLLWFEPERVCAATPWATEHAAWLLSVPRDRRAYNWGASQTDPDWVLWESRRNQITDGDLLFDFGNPQARRYLTDFMAQKIADFGVDCYRHDANIAPLEFLRAADAPDRQGVSEMRWVEGLYAFWDELLARFPRLTIDNCASGGRRIDLETISRSMPLWRTDHPGNAIGRQCHTYGLSDWVPLNGTGAVTPGVDDAYAMRSAYSSALAFGMFGVGDAPQLRPAPPDFPFEKAGAILAEYLAVQPYFLGDYYPLSEYSQATDAWMAWQFDRPDLGGGIVQAFRRPNSPHRAAAYPLAGLDDDAAYAIRNMDGGAETVMSGRELMQAGLPIEISRHPGSAILIYRRVKPAG